MKNICKLIVVLLFLSACKKQKNVDELQQFVGTWKITENYINSEYDNGIHSIYYLNSLPLDYLETTGITCEFKNNGFITFAHEKYGDDRFRITGMEAITVHFEPNTNLVGYNLKLKNRIGKQFIFFIAKDPFNNRLITVKWYKGRAYTNYDNIEYNNYNNNANNDISAKYTGCTSRLGSYEKL